MLNYVLTLLIPFFAILNISILSSTPSLNSSKILLLNLTVLDQSFGLPFLTLLKHSLLFSTLPNSSQPFFLPPLPFLNLRNPFFRLQTFYLLSLTLPYSLQPCLTPLNPSLLSKTLLYSHLSLLSSTFPYSSQTFPNLPNPFFTLFSSQ